MKFRETRVFNFLFKYSILWHKYIEIRPSKFGYCALSARYVFPLTILGLKNVFLHENTIVSSNSMIQATRAKFIMKKNSVAAEGLSVITGSHISQVGRWMREDLKNEPQLGYHQDVIVEEDVWIGMNVTITKGVVIGRGAIIGTGTVCRKSIPPYAIVVGNPAKVVGFRFRPEEILKHETELYNIEDRLDFKMLEANYNKYFVKNLKEIRELIKI